MMQDSGLEMKYIVELYKLWLRNKTMSNMGSGNKLSEKVA
jgi:hypothetical protein